MYILSYISFNNPKAFNKIIGLMLLAEKSCRIVSMNSICYKLWLQISIFRLARPFFKQLKLKVTSTLSKNIQNIATCKRITSSLSQGDLAFTFLGAATSVFTTLVSRRPIKLLKLMFFLAGLFFFGTFP